MKLQIVTTITTIDFNRKLEREEENEFFSKCHLYYDGKVAF